MKYLDESVKGIGTVVVLMSCIYLGTLVKWDWSDRTVLNLLVVIAPMLFWVTFVLGWNVLADIKNKNQKVI